MNKIELNAAEYQIRQEPLSWSIMFEALMEFVERAGVDSPALIKTN